MSLPPPTLPQIIDALLTLRMASLHTAMPGRVEAYDKHTQTASVQPMLKYGDVGEDGERAAHAYGIINAVPVMWLGGAGGHLTLPLKSGDTGLLVFCEGSIDRLKLRGGVVDPEDDRRFHLSDAVFFPGFRSLRDVIADAPDDAAVLAADDVRLGSASASQAVALKSDLEAIKPAVLAAMDAHIAVLAAGLPATVTEHAEALAKRADLALNWPACAQKVKAE